MVYSHLFIQQHAVPSGTVIELENLGPYLWIVRDIDLFVSTPGEYSVGVYDSADCTFFSATGTAGLDGEWLSWRGRQVFPLGDAINVSFSEIALGAGLDVRISGYQLSLP